MIEIDEKTNRQKFESLFKPQDGTGFGCKTTCDLKAKLKLLVAGRDATVQVRVCRHPMCCGNERGCESQHCEAIGWKTWPLPVFQKIHGRNPDGMENQPIDRTYDVQGWVDAHPRSVL